MKKTIAICVICIMTVMQLKAINYYVSAADGHDWNNDGLSPAKAFKNISRAADLTNPGDTVFVMNGTYTNSCEQCDVVTITRSGTPGKWIVYKNYPGHKPFIDFNGWNGIKIGNGTNEIGYIEVSGFTVRGNNRNVSLPDALNQPGGCNNPGSTAYDPRFNGGGIACDGRKGGHPHHIKINNNFIYECGGSGISAIQSDYITIDNNKIFNNSWYTIFGTSGISMWQNWNFDNNTSSYRMIVTNNKCYGNKLNVPWVALCQITDGNGIIIDDSKNTQNGSTLGPYKGKTLVANNLVFNNGGSGIHSYESENVDIINNTAYYNSRSEEINGGEIFANSSNNIKIFNNILVASPDKNINTNSHNTNVLYDYNLHFGGSGSSLTGPNTITGDPLFVNPSIDGAVADFHLASTSPAVDKGTASFSNAAAPITDAEQKARPIGISHDMGAYERGTAVSPSFTLTASVSSLTITPAASGTNPIAVTGASDFSGIVTFAVADLPAGVTADFSPASVTGTATTTMTLTAANTATIGPATVTITATSGNTTKSVTLNLNISINPNALPTVMLTAPANNATFTAGANVTLTADASDADGTVSKMEFYEGTTKLGEDASSPYAFEWINVPAGNYTLTAKATDNSNNSATSLTINILVKDPTTPNQPTNPTAALKAGLLISPNGDGVNEYWEVEDIIQHPDYQVSIYDRYGQLLYQAKPYANDWDGTYQGQPLPPEAYFFIITDADGRSIQNGSLTLIR